eukprot:TRINITY_DN1878_c0_g2_i8.p2 TRINITY_DN1878_c0_g2~~TRINITY_DN1878_c0_g2_i8.p2  ORF type:complete len:122 (-),score=2.18 TRINITY_DN1878_c0_g2_i8:214-579(-)
MFSGAMMTNLVVSAVIVAWSTAFLQGTRDSDGPIVGPDCRSMRKIVYYNHVISLATLSLLGLSMITIILLRTFYYMKQNLFASESIPIRRHKFVAKSIDEKESTPLVSESPNPKQEELQRK